MYSSETLLLICGGQQTTLTANVALPEFAALYALAVRLIDNTGMDQAQLRAGSVSAQLPLEVTVPDGSAVLGSVEHENGDVTVLFDSDRTAAEVVAFYRMQLTAAGWYEPATRRATGTLPGTPTNLAARRGAASSPYGQVGQIDARKPDTTQKCH